jgi:hypothetical protein
VFDPKFKNLMTKKMEKITIFSQDSDFGIVIDNLASAKTVPFDPKYNLTNHIFGRERFTNYKYLKNNPVYRGYNNYNPSKYIFFQGG